MTQKQIILRHLNSGRHLTILEAMSLYRIFNLKARIEELRRAGHNITTEMRSDPTGKKYARYRLEKS